MVHKIVTSNLKDPRFESLRKYIEDGEAQSVDDFIELSVAAIAFVMHHTERALEIDENPSSVAAFEITVMASQMLSLAGRFEDPELFFSDFCDVYAQNLPAMLKDREENRKDV